MSKVLITGATGFVGGAVCDQLLAAGRDVRVLSRDPSAAEGFAERGAELVAGDILDTDSLERALAGCEVVYHAAGVNGMCVRDPAPMFRANVTGTENVVRAASRAGARKIVYTSSAATIGEVKGVVADEHSPHRGTFLSNYERSKFEAEVAAFREAAVHGIALISVNPSSVQGPGRTRGTARLILDYVNGKLHTLVRSRFTLVDVDDCARGHLLAEEHGVSGERYLLAGACVSTDEALRTVARIAGIEHRTVNLPPAAALVAASGAETVARIRGAKPRLCREMAATLLHGHAYDGSRAERELGLTYISFDDMVRKTLAWYGEHGMITVPIAATRAD
jgi:dihydroflavonol-4-reductase